MHCEEADMAIRTADLEGLLRLLDEDDETRADSLIDQVARMDGADRERILDHADDCSQAVRDNVERAVIRGRYLAREAQWEALAQGSAGLEEGLKLIDGTADDLPAVDVSARLDELSREVGDRLTGDRAFDVGLTVIAEVLSQVRGLRGNETDYYAPGNSYLPNVLATGLGIPISLCSIAILVGRRLELPVHGVGAPGHFLGFYGEVELKLGSYFDPYEGFRRLTRGEIHALLAPFTNTVDPAMLRPASDREILLRFLRNLAGAYGREGSIEHVRNLERWQQLISP